MLFFYILTLIIPNIGTNIIIPSKLLFQNEHISTFSRISSTESSTRFGSQEVLSSKPIITATVYVVYKSISNEFHSFREPTV